MLALALAGVLAADHQFIVPLIGRVDGASGHHVAYGVIVNPTPRQATVRRTGLFPG